MSRSPSAALVGVVYGNTLLWSVAAFVAAAAFRPGLAWSVAFKPVDFLFALPLLWREWRGLVVVVTASVMVLPFWFDWASAIGNMTGRPGILYAVPAWPVLGVCLLAGGVSPRWRRRVGRLIHGRALHGQWRSRMTVPVHGRAFVNEDLPVTVWPMIAMSPERLRFAR